MENTFWLLGMQREILADAGQTNGAYDLIATTSGPGAETPPHIHYDYTETEYVLEGELTIHTNSEVIVLRPGQAYTIRRGVPHALMITGERTTRLLTVFSPGGFSRVVRVAGKACDDPSREQTDLTLFNELSGQIGDITLGPKGSRPW